MLEGPGKPKVEPQEQDPKTRIQKKPSSAHSSSARQSSGDHIASTPNTPSASDAKSHVAQKASVSSSPEVQLTQIRKSIREQNNSQGFAKAKMVADRALAQNKILLNNRFVLEATLGAGGMGTVYKAKDLRKVEAADPNPYVAVKVLNEDFKNHPDAFVTLQREASRSHILSHPNIVTVHDFDRDGDVIFMTMELLVGQGLDALIRQHRGKGVPKEKALSIIRDYGMALAHAHQKNIVHSDLKPGNIFVCAHSSKVLDFGIARITNSANGDFDAGSLGALTLAYASLEMIEGEAPHPSDDVYAAAIIAYELFTGEHPYKRKSAEIALKEKLRPAPIKFLSKQQWKTLEKALKLRRSERLQDITAFYKGLTQKKRSIKALLAGTVLISVLAGTIGYKYFAGDELAERIADTYKRGEECLAINDFSCAIDHAKAVLQLNPSHKSAQNLLQAAEQRLLEAQIQQISSRFEQCLANEDEQCAVQSVQNLKQLGAAEIAPSLQLRLQQFQQQRQLQLILQSANDCADAGDWQCVLDTLQPISHLSEPLMFELREKAVRALEGERQRNIMAHKEFNAAMSRAEECLASNEFDCAKQQVQRAKSTGVNGAQAESFLQTTLYAEREFKANLQKARNVLAKGEDCMAKKNYSCAIASSDSALEFLPNYAPALALRERAQKAIDELKRQIQIE